MAVNLNTLAPPRATFDFAEQQRTTSAEGVTVHFGDVASAAEDFILGSDMIVGCVAWVRGPRMAAALQGRPVALVVNKEFGLRVEGSRERAPLMTLKGGVPARILPDPKPTTAKLDAVRCAGWAVRGRFGALMHHKFLVRIMKKGRSYVPTAVWTGSFNMTTGAESNIENGMVITEPAIVSAFLAEFSRVWAISEPLAFAVGAPTPGGGKGGAVRKAKKRKTKKRTSRRTKARRA